MRNFKKKGIKIKETGFFAPHELVKHIGIDDSRKMKGVWLK